LKEIEIAIKDMKEFQKTHIEWAEFFEENPAVEEKYVATGEWDTAKKHREIAIKYDKIIKILNKK